MKYLGVLVLICITISGFAQGELYLKNTNNSKLKKINVGSHIRIRTRDSIWIRGFLNSVNDSTLFLHNDTITVTQIARIDFTPTCRKKIGNGLLVSGVVMGGIGAFLVAYVTYNNLDTDPFTIVGEAFAVSILVAVPTVLVIGLSQLVKTKGHYPLDGGNWQLLVE
ncbi:MAG: hypothetical protein JXQ87_14680 [Bacteroidia bacterium]